MLLRKGQVLTIPSVILRLHKRVDRSVRRIHALLQHFAHAIDGVAVVEDEILQTAQLNVQARRELIFIYHILTVVFYPPSN